MSLGRFTAQIVLLVCAAAFRIETVFACPLIGERIDFNCDRKLKIAAVGDSIVKGRQDLDFNEDGGWIKRVGLATGSAKHISNLGFPGITSSELLRNLKRDLKKPRSRIARGLSGADVVVVAVGVNDFFQENDPGLTVRNIKRIVKFLRTTLPATSNSPPFMLVAKLTPTTRGFQRVFIEDTNRLLARYRSEALPSYLRFDLMHEENVSFDGIHPDSDGYTELSEIFFGYFDVQGRASMLALRPDGDKDGIYDRFEERLFGTDPLLRDTDSDGLKDGKEVFRRKPTDSLVFDTDGDGFGDGDEVAAHTNPLDPLSFPGS